MPADWELYLQKEFPGFLLPKSEHHRVTVETAKAFLSGLGVSPRNLLLLRAASVIAGHTDALSAFASFWLPELVRVLPSRALVEQRLWRGGYQGRLDVRATLAHHIAGERDAFVTRARRRDFDLPENVFVRSLASRTSGLLAELQGADFLSGHGWTAEPVRALSSLQRLLEGTALREVAMAPVDQHQLHAVKHARHPAYRAALDWYRHLSNALDHEDSERLAKTLSEGALQPMCEAKRFEVAVLLVLLDGIAQRLPESDGWQVTRGLIASGRQAIATFSRGVDGAEGEVSVFYDQAVLPTGDELGPRDAGVQHYFGAAGRMRPDITVRVRARDGGVSFTVFELKLTEDVSYAASGFGEAIVYRHEYAPYLRGWPKAVLVTSRRVEGMPRREDDVVAVGWDRLGASEVVDGMLVGGAG